MGDKQEQKNEQVITLHSMSIDDSPKRESIMESHDIYRNKMQPKFFKRPLMQSSHFNGKKSTSKPSLHKLLTLNSKERLAASKSKLLLNLDLPKHNLRWGNVPKQKKLEKDKPSLPAGSSLIRSVSHTKLVSINQS